MTWNITIGLETHIQLSTQSKIFSGSSTYFNPEPNLQTNEIDLALPGTLPVMNRQVVESAIRFGLAIGANISPYSQFSRKHYFYPDLPKGYQISQFELPIIKGGSLSFIVNKKRKTVHLIRAHLEEDAGKSLHENYFLSNGKAGSGIDLNRSGIPLLEIVTKPEIHSTSEALEYLKTLRNLVMYLNICNGNMQEGSFRCDANISVCQSGDNELGVRTEIKNINSFRFLERAISFEARRQIELIENGNTVIQETRLYDSIRNETRSMRNKENSQDYRYLPDPDLPMLTISTDWIQNIKLTMPELPDEKRLRFMSKYDIPYSVAEKLVINHHIADYFEEVIRYVPKNQYRLCANWIIDPVITMLNREGRNTGFPIPISSTSLAKLINHIADEGISNSSARMIFSDIWHGKYNESIDSVIESYCLKQSKNSMLIETIIDEIIIENPFIIKEYRLGKTKVLNSLMGHIINKIGKNINFQRVFELLKEKLNT